MGHKGRWEYLRAIYERYRKAGRQGKQAILNEFCANTGYHRKYAIRLLNGPPPEKRRKPPRRRGRSNEQETLAVLTAVWEAEDYTIPKWAKPTTPEAILDEWAKKPLDFDRGTRWQYSNRITFSETHFREGLR